MTTASALPSWLVDLGCGAQEDLGGVHHGFAQRRVGVNRIDQITDGVFQVKPGSLFPALHRLEQEGWVKGKWGESENNRRAKFYELTAAGRRRLGEEKRNWAHVVLAITKVMEAT